MAVDRCPFGDEVLLELNNLQIGKKNKKGTPVLPVVSNLTLTLRPGEMWALVGESGSGKSVTASAILGILPENLTITRGTIHFQRKNITHLSEREWQRLRGRHLSLVFQDYAGSFTPFNRIGSQMVETYRCHYPVTYRQARFRVLEALERLHLPGERVYRSYPFQLSGGQLQRTALATAALLRPSLLIADEPTTALDMLTGKQILDWIEEIRRETGCAVLYITHQLDHLIDRSDGLAVMYGGEIVEQGKCSTIRNAPHHPYTRMLFNLRPDLANPPRRLPTIPGEPGERARTGCPFAVRCPERFSACNEKPDSITIDDHQQASCHLERGWRPKWEKKAIGQQ